MSTDALSIGDLADEAGLSRRAVRFYVQRGLLPSPRGLGRGKHYDQAHRERLKKIGDLQAAGHSLDAIEKILAGRAAPPPTPPRRARAAVSAELWTRMRLADGVELSFDATRFAPSAEALVALRDAATEILRQCDKQNDSNT